MTYLTFPACGDFCRLLITFENSLDPDQDQQNVGPDLDSKHFDILIVFLKEFFEKVNFEKSQQMTTNKRKITQDAKNYLSFILVCVSLQINVSNVLGQTALFHCVIRGDVSTAYKLLKKGADPSIRGTVWETRKRKR